MSPEVDQEIDIEITPSRKVSVSGLSEFSSNQGDEEVSTHPFRKSQPIPRHSVSDYDIQKTLNSKPSSSRTPTVSKQSSSRSSTPESQVSKRRFSEPEPKLHVVFRKMSLSPGLDKRSLSDFQRPQSPEVKQTDTIQKGFDESGLKRINDYIILQEIGRGVHGKVKLCVDSKTNEQFAMKIVKKNLRKRFGVHNNPVEKVKVEIAILKKSEHENVVRLYEVLDSTDSSKIYLILEYLEGGSVVWQSDENGPHLSEDLARKYFRDVLLGLEYLHHQGIVHRDIKPANLLVTKENRVKISDFGVSHQSTGEETNIDFSLAKTAGTPAFFAPELCAGIPFSSSSSLSSSDSNLPSMNPPQKPSVVFEHLPITKAIDIWALGATLYCFIFGKIPFNASNEFELYSMIRNDEIQYEGVEISANLKDLLQKLLEKDPRKRITIPEIKAHPWTTEDMKYPEKWIEETDPSQHESIHVTLEEVKDAVTLFGKFKKKLRRLSNSFGSLVKPRSKSETSSDNSRSSTLNSNSDFNSTFEEINSSIYHHRTPSSNSLGLYKPTIQSSRSQELLFEVDSDESERVRMSFDSHLAKETIHEEKFD